MVEAMPDLHFLGLRPMLPAISVRETGPAHNPDSLDWMRTRNASTTSPTRHCEQVRTRYSDNTITKDRLFDYVYGILHALDYRERFATDLAKGLTRVPLAGDFHAFANAGRALSDLHLGYERCAEYPLTLESSRDGHPRPEHLRLGRRAMRFKDDEKTVLELNEHARLTGIPGRSTRVPGERPNGAGMVHRPVPDRAGQRERNRQRPKRLV